MLANIEFHAGRPWPLDVALWDLAGKIADRPVWSLVGGLATAIRAYASSGLHRPSPAMVELAQRWSAMGFPALKVRFGRPRWRDDIAVDRAVRDAVGDTLELMVDCNQGWRMPWDTAPPWDVEHAHRRSPSDWSAEHVYWMEEPLHRGDYDGHGRAAPTGRHPHRRRRADPRAVRVPRAPRSEAASTCSSPTACAPKASPVCAGSPTTSPRAGKTFTPHTWGNGHRAARQRPPHGRHRRTPFLEFPFDPPEWTTARRDFMLTETIEVDGEGWIELGDRPGLGCTLDNRVLTATASAAATFT